jgi:predicted CXXCH cytochrome family protein
MHVRETLTHGRKAAAGAPLGRLVAVALAAAAWCWGPVAAAQAPAASPATAPVPEATQEPAARAPAPAQGVQAAPPTSERCGDCHEGTLRRRVVHAAMQKTTCQSCHKAAPQRVGRCKSASTSAWVLTKPQGDLCRACHVESDLSSKFKVKHDFKGKCVDCHDTHSSDQPHLMKATGKKLCLSCHDVRAGRREVTSKIDITRKVVHAALEKRECQDCHEAGHGGQAPKFLKREQPELCYGCHKRQDQHKYTHTAVRQGECLECHDAHSSNLPALAKKPREEMCLGCHEVEPLLTRATKHAPVGEGRCLDCHESHGGEQPAFVSGVGKANCMKCHDPKAPQGKGAVTPAFRVDLQRKFVHAAMVKNDCNDCHEAGHGSDNPRLLRKSPTELCYNCHNRKDTAKFVHSAVRLGDCATCHLPHASDNKALLAKASVKETCFLCHQDDVTGRSVIHKPVAEGRCDECHAAHGAPHRYSLSRGDEKKTCYACHKPVDAGKVKHAALERYGCSGCHDPHGAGNRWLLGKKTNDLCAGCHPGQNDGRHVTPMVLAGHIIKGPTDPRRPDRELTCASCHNPHGSDHAKLFYLGDSGMESCAGCHGDKSGKNPGVKDVAWKAGQPRQVEGQGATGAGGGGGGGGGGSGSAASSLWPDVAARYATPAPAEPRR